MCAFLDALSDSLTATETTLFLVREAALMFILEVLSNAKSGLIMS